MNAPFKAPGLRDQFSAYVCDEDTLDVIRPIAAEMGWQVEKCYKGGLRNAVQSLSISASPNILFVDLSESGDPLNDINALAEVCEPGTVVIATGQVNDVRLYRDLLGSGIQDYLLKPFSPDQLRDSLAQAQAVFNAPRQVEMGADRPHILSAVIGVRGGAGASSVATSIAWLMSAQLARHTALLDLDIHFGTGALSMDLEPGRGLTDAIDNPSRIDGLFIERAMVRASDRLSILSAEAPIHQPVLTDGSAFFQLQEELKGGFETTIVDIPRNMLIQYPHLMTDMQSVVVVTELTLAGARDTIRILAWLRTNAPQTQIIVVANRVPAGPTEISRKEFEESIERPIDVLVNEDSKVFIQAAKLGKTVGEVAKSTKTGQALLAIANKVIANDHSDDQSEEAGGKGKGKVKAKSTSLAGKMGGFKSLLSKKDKA